MPSSLRAEPFLTLKEAAGVLKIPYWKLQRASRRGDVQTYRFFNARPLVRLSELILLIEASREGGDHGR